MTVKELQAQYDAKQKLAKQNIKAEPNRGRRCLKWLKYWLLFPWQWVWVNIRDWRTALIFVIVVLVVSSEVWVMYLLGLITGNPWFYGVASACWLFWLGPGTPFMVICISLTIVIKGLFDKIRAKRKV